MKKTNLWGATVNGYGLWFADPKQLYYDEFEESYWDKGGNMEINKVGIDVRDGVVVTFASENKAEVEAFINGIKAVSTIVSNGLHYHKLPKDRKGKLE